MTRSDFKVGIVGAGWIAEKAAITLNGPDRVYVETIPVPKQITGYEYQFVACRDAIAAGLTEPPQMPLDETLYIMELMDGLRQDWDVRYPMDEIDWK